MFHQVSICIIVYNEQGDYKLELNILDEDRAELGCLQLTFSMKKRHQGWLFKIWTPSLSKQTVKIAEVLLRKAWLTLGKTSTLPLVCLVGGELWVPNSPWTLYGKQIVTRKDQRTWERNEKSCCALKRWLCNRSQRFPFPHRYLH